MASFAVTGLENDVVVRRRLRRLLAVGMLLVVIGLVGEGLGRGWRNVAAHRQPAVGPLAPVSRALFAWLQAHTGPDDVPIFFFKPRAMHLFTGREAVMRTHLAGVPPGTFVVWYEHPDVREQPSREALEAHPRAGGALVYRNPQFQVVRLSGGGQPR